MTYRENTICIRKMNRDYKIFTVTSGSDGSIYIHIPYCVEKKGYVFLHSVDYSKKGWNFNSINKDFVVDHTAKMSIHPEGFVQFSGRGILSGRDPTTGDTRGIGINSAPLHTPISTGPTALISCWGLELGFEEKSEKLKKNRLNIVLKENDFILRLDESGPPSVYLFEFFIFPPRFSPPLRIDEHGSWLTISFPMYKDKGSIFTFPVINVRGLKNLVGILPFRAYSEFPQKFPFGYTMQGPSGLDKSKKNFEAIGCTYPRIFDGVDISSLNYSL